MCADILNFKLGATYNEHCA